MEKTTKMGINSSLRLKLKNIHCEAFTLVKDSDAIVIDTQFEIVSDNNLFNISSGVHLFFDQVKINNL